MTAPAAAASCPVFCRHRCISSFQSCSRSQETAFQVSRWHAQAAPSKHCAGDRALRCCSSAMPLHLWHSPTADSAFSQFARTCVLRRARQAISSHRISKIAKMTNSKNAAVANALNSGSTMMPALDFRTFKTRITDTYRHKRGKSGLLLHVAATCPGQAGLMVE